MRVQARSKTSSRDKLWSPRADIQRFDPVLVFVLRASAALAGLVAIVITIFVLKEAGPALLDIGPARFALDDAWFPTSGRFGMVPMLLGTVLCAGLAMLIAVPTGVVSALWLNFYAPKTIATWYRRLLELLAGIPSVVYGFWGLVALVPVIARFEPPGASLLAGALVLAVMVLPTVALISDCAIMALPREQMMAARALGTSTVGALFHVVLPAARPGIRTAIILALGRAVGETMAVLMVCGNVVQVPGSIFDPVRTLTANIALEMAYATEAHRSVLFVSGLFLVVLVVLLVLGNRAADRRPA